MTTNYEAYNSWINQHEKRKKSNSLSSLGPRLISYSTPIAYIDTEHLVLFVCRKSYSVTTAGNHKSLIRTPANYLCIRPEEVRYLSPVEMLESAADALTTRLKEISRQRKNIEPSVNWHNKNRAELIEAAKRYSVQLLNLPPEIRLPESDLFAPLNPEQAFKKQILEVLNNESI